MTPEESVAQAIAQATAKPAKLFEKDAIYTISTTVDGAEYALTFILPKNVNTMTTNPSVSSVQLLPLKEGDVTQMWQPREAGVDPVAYLMYARVSDDTSRLTGIMEIQNVNSEFSDPDNDTFHDKYNRTTVGYHSNESTEYWYIDKLPNGLFRIMNYLGHKNNLNTEGGSSTYKWNESHSLAAFKGADGKVKLRHMVTEETPSQQWKFNKVGFFTAS